jgi:glycerol-3-phosphate dehydrogenase
LDPYGPWPATRDLPAGLPIEAEDADHLRRLYGAEAAGLLARIEAEPGLGRRLSQRAGRHDLAVQVVHGVLAEGARTLDDLVDRRLVLGTLGPPTRAELVAVAQVAAPLLDWSAADAAAAVEQRSAADADRLAHLSGSRFDDLV